MRQRLGYARVFRAIAMSAVIVAALAPAASAADPGVPDDSTTIVSGTSFDAGSLPPAPAAVKPDARAMASHSSHQEGHVAAHGADARQPHVAARRTESSGGSVAASAVTEDFSAFGGIQDRLNDSTYPVDANGAVIGDTLLTANDLTITARSASTLAWKIEWALPTFFKIPNTEYYWGGFVSASVYKGRFVAAMPSFESGCTRSWLNVAVSKTSNPAGGWNLFRIAIADAWTDLISIGVSDDKVVLAINQWDMNTTDCIADTFEGAWVRVADWADLIDGGTLTIKDVSATPRTDYYSWVAASNVPTAPAAGAGSTLRLVGDQFVNGAWGHVAYASVTGSAKTGTAALSGLSDLTASTSLEPLVGPPATIAAFPSGNGFQDERVISAVARAGKVWFSTNATCQPAGQIRACARIVELDASASPPTTADQAWFLTDDSDTFHPLVGITLNGSAFFTMTRAAATAPTTIDTYATYRNVGSPIAGPDEELIQTSGHAWPLTGFAPGGSIAFDATQGDTAFAVIPDGCLGTYSCAEIIRLRSNLPDDPGGTATMGNYGTGWSPGIQPKMNYMPLATSPIKWVRVSGSPTTEDTAEGPRLVSGTTLASTAFSYPDLSASTVFGDLQGQSIKGWVQWSTGAAWSTPIEVDGTIDMTPATWSQGPLAFAIGTVGATVPVRLTWSASDGESGIAEVSHNWNCTGSDSGSWMLPGTATTVVKALHLNATCTQYYVLPINGSGIQTGPLGPQPTITVKAIQGTTTGLVYGKTWGTQTSSSFLGGSTRYATAAGATFTYTFTGRAIGFVTTKAPNRGKAEVWVDGKKLAVLDLKATKATYRQLVWQKVWGSAGKHVVRIKVLGTAGRPRVDADAFVKF